MLQQATPANYDAPLRSPGLKAQRHSTSPRWDPFHIGTVYSHQQTPCRSGERLPIGHEDRCMCAFFVCILLGAHEDELDDTDLDSDWKSKGRGASPSLFG